MWKALCSIGHTERELEGMSVTETELISINFVILGLELLDSLESIDRFGRNFYEYRWSTTNNASGGTGRRVSLDRDRIHIDLTPHRSTVLQEYPHDDGIPALSEIVHQALNYTEKPLAHATAHGFNAELSFQTGEVSAFRHIAATLFTGFPQINDWSIVGGSARMTFLDSSGVVRNISIEPRFMNEQIRRAYLNINLHIEKPGEPSKDEILAGFHKIVGDARSFMETLHV